MCSSERDISTSVEGGREQAHKAARSQSAYSITMHALCRSTGLRFGVASRLHTSSQRLHAVPTRPMVEFSVRCGSWETWEVEREPSYWR